MLPDNALNQFSIRKMGGHMERIQFDYINALPFIEKQDWQDINEKVVQAHHMLSGKTGEGRDFLGWLDFPEKIGETEIEQIEEAAAEIKSKADAFIVIGIGGSYLGARAAMEMLNHPFHNQQPRAKRNAPEVYYAGHHLSSAYIHGLFDILEGKEVAVNVISKSGTTTEPAIAFRIFKDYLEKRYGKAGARSRIYVTTDQRKGALKQLAVSEQYRSFVVPDDIGGRYSVLTPVGLLPMAVSGIDIHDVIAGARHAVRAYGAADLAQNEAYQYAALRHLLYRKGKTMEILACYDPAFTAFAEWWKQLFGESEGKKGQGIFPASVQFTTDLHSLGQYIQDGLRNLFETAIMVEKPEKTLLIEHVPDDFDGLNILAGKPVHFVNRRAFESTVLAHTDGGVPNLAVMLPEISPFYFGALVYFFEKACAMSGYLSGINPFDQPGVEVYKKNMFALLGKPGFDQGRAALEKRLNPPKK
jgi:glucose-6-phosphate isomerase